MDQTSRQVGAIWTLGALAAVMASTIAAAGVATPVPTCGTTPLAPVPSPIVTTGQVAARNGRVIRFEADAGFIRVGGTDAADARIGSGDGHGSAAADQTDPTADMSYVAYMAKGVPSAARPLLFLWDGGPGSASRPPLMGSFGPILQTVPAGYVENAVPSTGAFVRPNPDTLLDVADLVFIDAPGTGFGHVDGCGAGAAFYGTDVDIAAFQRFIRRFIETHDRAKSRIFLFGESYGGTRAAILARKIQEAGTPVAGIVLMSSPLSYDSSATAGTLDNVGTENPFFLSLPSFAATAWYHGKVSHTGDLTDWLHGVEAFALETYGPALLLGDQLPDDRKRKIADQLAAYTGIPARTWLDVNLRLDGTRFRKMLESDQGKLVGRQDTRVDGPIPAVPGSVVGDDPSLYVDRYAHRNAFDEYGRGTLGWGGRKFNFEIPDETVWDYSHVTDPNTVPGLYFNVAPDLIAAMTRNPSLDVLMIGGYFDLAVPYFSNKYMVSQMHLSDNARAHLQTVEYSAGHSVYETEDARQDMRRRIAKMIAR